MGGGDNDCVEIGRHTTSLEKRWYRSSFSTNSSINTLWFSQSLYHLYSILCDRQSMDVPPCSANQNTAHTHTHSILTHTFIVRNDAARAITFFRDAIFIRVSKDAVYTHSQQPRDPSHACLCLFLYPIPPPPPSLQQLTKAANVCERASEQMMVVVFVVAHRLNDFMRCDARGADKCYLCARPCVVCWCNCNVLAARP